ncbi:MAG: hypothetical protein SPI54_09290 [Oscillospiraceae bacterium]|nr:hypothetical protein [Ruminococcus sp.]MDY6062072.1 hypothetical protein [Oscillospiraceae bacterium]
MSETKTVTVKVTVSAIAIKYKTPSRPSHMGSKSTSPTPKTF